MPPTKVPQSSSCLRILTSTAWSYRVSGLGEHDQSCQGFTPLAADCYPFPIHLLVQSLLYSALMAGSPYLCAITAHVSVSLLCESAGETPWFGKPRLPPSYSLAKPQNRLLACTGKEEPCFPPKALGCMRARQTSGQTFSWAQICHKPKCQVPEKKYIYTCIIQNKAWKRQTFSTM